MIQCTETKWRRWNSWVVASPLLLLEIVPELGGRIMNYQLGGHLFLWTNPRLQGASLTTDSAQSPDTWPNWGGDKVWLAPQGWENEDQWMGPPDPVLDAGCFQAELLTATEDEVRIRLKSEPDPRSGMQLSRLLCVRDGSTRVNIVSKMTNRSDRVRRWGIWPVTQIDAGSRVGDGWNTKLRTYVPLNSKSVHPLGYRVIYGSETNPQYKSEGDIIGVYYMHQVGKIGVDSDAGWVAILDGETGHVLVQQMTFDREAEYPDQASVEVWTNGTGSLTAYGRTEEMPTDLESNPYMMECELVSPFARLAPGESFEFQYSWASANVGADGASVVRISACNQVGCEVERFLILKSGEMQGRYGVFYPGECWVEFLDADGRMIANPTFVSLVSPLRPFLLSGIVAVPEGAMYAVLNLYGGRDDLGPTPSGKSIGELATVFLPMLSRG